MCLAIPVRITAINGETATIDVSGNESHADLSVLPNVAVGDYVLVHAGMAIQRIDEAEAKISLDLFRELAEKLEQP